MVNSGGTVSASSSSGGGSGGKKVGRKSVSHTCLVARRNREETLQKAEKVQSEEH